LFPAKFANDVKASDKFSIDSLALIVVIPLFRVTGQNGIG